MVDGLLSFFYWKARPLFYSPYESLSRQKIQHDQLTMLADILIEETPLYLVSFRVFRVSVPSLSKDFVV